jgi:hypothetical protein
MFQVFLNQILLLQFTEAWGSYCYSGTFCWQNLQILADLFCLFLGTEKKKTTLQMLAEFNIFSQEIWVQFLMALG